MSIVTFCKINIIIFYLLVFMMKQNKANCNFEIEGMSANMHYLFAYPYPFTQSKSTGQHALLTYSNQDTTIGDLTKQFQKIFTEYSKKQNLYFTLSKGYLLQKKWTVSYVKKLLKRSNIDGISVYLQSDDDAQSEIYINQHGCLHRSINNQPQFNSSVQILFSIKFILPSKNDHIITINGFYQQKTYNFIEKLLLEIKRQFSAQLTFDSLEGLYIRKNSQKLRLDIYIEANNLITGDEVQVVCRDQTLKFDIVPPQQSANKLKIYDMNMDLRTLNYDLVKYQTLGSIYKTYFGKHPSLNKIYLKIMNVIISEDQTVEKAKQFFKQSQFTKIIVSGFIISQKVFFDLQIYNSQKVDWKALEFDQKTRTKINQHIEKIKKPKMIFQKRISDQTFLELVYLYTSQTTKDGLTIYQCINEYLRTRSISQICLKDNKEQWKYRFLNNFIKKMHLLKNVKSQTVYRGVNYVPNQKVGQRLLFKSFSSASKCKRVAFQHPIYFNKRRNLYSDRFSLFIMKIEEVEKNQEEILIEPYSQFHIQKIVEKQFQFNEIQYPFVVFTLKQVKSSLNVFRDNKNTLILWIDDKPQEGLQIYSKIQEATDSNIDSLIFKQFSSTQDYAQWLQNNKDIIKNQNFHTVVISNMRRKENGIINPIAGINCLNELIKYTCKVPFIFYVQNTNRTQSHVKELSFVQRPIIYITEYQQDLIAFIKKYTPLNLPQEEQSFCSVQ